MTPRGRERGAAMLLAFLALLVLVAVVGQLSVSSSVDRAIALHALEETRYEYAARGAYHEACALLLKDAKDDAQAAEDQGTGVEGDAFGGGLPQGRDQSQRQEGIATDSLADDWADPSASSGGGSGGGGDDVEVKIRIVDEDRKMNVLCLVAQDAGFRELWKERMVRLLDRFREDTKYDLSAGEARDLVDGFEKWLRGDRGLDFPRPSQATTPTEDDKMVFSHSRFSNQEEPDVVFPLTLDELLAVEGMSESLLHGFVENGRYVPGLEDVLTVHTNLRIDPDALAGEEEEDDGLGDSPFDAGGSQEEVDEEEDQPPDTDQATETNQGRVNVNTAPLVVLAALMEEDRVPYSVVEKIDEFRRKVLEVSQDQQDQDFGIGESEARHLSETAEEEDEDFVFDDPDAVIDRVEDWFDAKLNVGEQERKDFGDALAVQSHVFTIFVELRRRRQGFSGGGGAWRPPDRVYRAVVWRRQVSEGEFQTVPILPLAPFRGAVPPDTDEYRDEHPFDF